MGRVDLFHSRRANYHKCLFWIRNQSGSASQWILNNEPSGAFYARPVSAKSGQMNALNGVWAFDNNHITIESDDEIDDLTRGCIVKYDDDLWLVESTQRLEHRKESEFSKNTDYRYIIALTKAKG